MVDRRSGGTVRTTPRALLCRAIWFLSVSSTSSSSSSMYCGMLYLHRLISKENEQCGQHRQHHRSNMSEPKPSRLSRDTLRACAGTYPVFSDPGGPAPNDRTTSCPSLSFTTCIADNVWLSATAVHSVSAVTDARTYGGIIARVLQA